MEDSTRRPPLLPCFLASLAFAAGLLLTACSDNLLAQVSEDIQTYKQGENLPSTRKPVIDVLEWQNVSNATTNNPTVSLTITASPKAVDASGPAVISAYLLRESSAAPAADDPAWTDTKPSSFSFPAVNGSHALNAWVKDSLGNVSDVSSLTITLAPLGADWESSYSEGMVVTAHEELTLTCLEDLPSDPLVVLVDEAADLASAAVGGTGNRTVTIRPGATGTGLWSASSGLTVKVQMITALGLSLEKTIGISPFSGVCVSASAGASGASGTRFHPLSAIQEGIDKAVEKYGTGPADVRVAGGTYSVACSVGLEPTPDVYVADIEPGISLHGGYTSDFATRTGGTTELLDLSSSADNSGLGDPVRVVNVSGNPITTATVIDGLTITLGYGGSEPQIHCGIVCMDGSAPTIQDVIIQGTSSTTLSPQAIGILCSSSSPSVTNCDIDPGESLNWSRGVYIQTAGSPAISSSKVSGGESNRTVGIRVNAGTSPSISGSTVIGGMWTTAGYCIYINEANPSIESNVFEISLNKPLTYAVYELGASSDPDSLKNNLFNYVDDGLNWYVDEGTTGVGSTNHDTQTIDNGNGPILLFSADDGNTHK